LFLADDIGEKCTQFFHKKSKKKKEEADIFISAEYDGNGVGYTTHVVSPCFGGCNLHPTWGSI
jgi:hypothetical protein